MKEVYLDTNIFNKLLDFLNEKNIEIEQLSQIIASKNYVILFSPTIFEELLHTVNSSLHKTADLIRLSYRICSKDCIIKQPKSLIADDLKCFLRGKKKNSPFIIGEERRRFIKVWEKANNIDFFSNVPQNVLKQSQNKKKGFLAFNKQSKKEFSPCWKPYQEIEFQEFYQDSLENAEGKGFVKDVCIKCLGEEDGNLVYQKLDLKDLRHLRFLIKAKFGLIYNTLLKDKKPKWGDNIDIHHIILSSVADTFVTGDKDMQELFGILDEKEPECINFEEFKKLLNL